MASVAPAAPTPPLPIIVSVQAVPPFLNPPADPAQSAGNNGTSGGGNWAAAMSGFENLMHTVGYWAAQLGKDVVTSTVAAGIVEAAKKYGPAALSRAGQLWSTATSPAGQAAIESQLNAESPGLGTAMNDLSLTAGSPTGVQLYQLIQNGLGEVGTIVDSLQ